MAKKPDAAVELSAKMTGALESLRARGNVEYPPTLERLRAAADPDAPPELALKALTKPPLAQRALAAHKKNLAAPVALREDAERLLGSAAILHFTLRLLCTEAAPTATVAKLKAKLDTPLRGPFQQAVERQIADNTLPPDVEWLPKGKVLHPRWLPLPKAPEVELAERLVRVLESQRGLGPASYPVRLRRLIELSGPDPAARLLTKALASEPCASRALRLATKHPDSPVALTEDAAEAVANPAVLDFLLDTGRTETVQGFTAAELKARLIKQVQAPFAAALDRHLETGAIPAGTGCIAIKKNRVWFRLADVRAARSPKPPVLPVAGAPAPAADFVAAFEEAFTHLDRTSGAHNFVSLVELRRALPFDRATFDAALRRLRASGRYTLSAAEGRHGIHDEERAAGIPEEGSLLLFVSRT